MIDSGKVIAKGTPDSLKARVGSDRLEITISKKSDLETAKKAIDGKSLQVDEEKYMLSIATKGGIAELKKVLAKLEEAKVQVESVELRRPTLDDVFLTLTGHAATKETSENNKKGGKNE
jgi:ABC-2 type transport system ATP-binding protein